MKTVKTSELSGRALDYAVALAIGAKFEMTKYGICIVSGDGFFHLFTGEFAVNCLSTT